MINRDVLYTQEQRSDKTRWVVVLVVASLAALAVGLLVGSLLGGGSADDGDESELEMQVQDLQSQVTDLEAKLREVEAEAASLVSALETVGRSDADLRTRLEDAQAAAAAAQAALEQQESELASSTESVTSLETRNEELSDRVAQLQGQVDGLEDAATTAENHRLLLVEMRKDPPDSRDGAFDYWNTMKERAVQANPALSSPVDRVILKVDNFFDWAERSPDAAPTSEEYVAWLAERVTSGAAAYQESADAFFKDALLSTITQMEAIVVRLS